LTADDIAERCASEPLEATEIGVSDTEITIEVAADVGSPLAPGLFQGAFDAVTAFADHINASGGIGCRQLVVRTWDTKMDPNESKNGLIDACANAVAMVGNVALFNPDVSVLTSCPDLEGAPTGVPDMAALTQDVGELCGPTVFVIQLVVEKCPIAVGQPRDMTAVVGPTAYLVEQHPGLHGLYLVPGDLPTTRQSAVPQIAGQETEGVVFDDVALVSGRDEQAAFTPRVQALKASGATYVYNGSNDVAMMKMQKEAAAQGVDMSSVVWACTLACYTRNFQENAGPTGEGTYMWMQFLPFEEADTNAALQAYVDGVGADKVDAFGAQAWQAAIAFQQVVNQIVMEDGPNAITRAAILEGLANLEDFGADGWAGPKGLRETSDCFVLLQLRGGEFERVWPEERGTFDCKPENLAVVNVEPVSAAEQYG
jgi:ABC-type branched-subunit amino acid transport system substrate-binding protein